jgi:hypothetical protein
MKFRNREALQTENDSLRLTVLTGGGHIAEILHKRTGVSPLWVPPWASIDPSEYDPATHPQYGLNQESKLLSGIMGHNLCLDIFGPPSPEEAAKGISVHGEASVARYDGEIGNQQVHVTALLPCSSLRITRNISLDDSGIFVRITEQVENLSSIERPIAWTQHVSLGPPFLEPGKTQFHTLPERSRVFESAGFDAGGLVRGADFEWPYAPSHTHSLADLRFFANNGRSSSLTTHLIDQTLDKAFFVAYSPTAQLLFGYEWDRKDFPWLGIWEENKSRLTPPWQGKAIASGMEFGVSPFPETKKQMVGRGLLFGVPTFRRLRAREQVTVHYSAFIRQTDGIPGECSFSSEVASSAAPGD